MKDKIKKGDKFTTNFSDGKIYTAKSFFGSSGIEYDSYSEASAANNGGEIYIKNEEYGGVTEYVESNPLEEKM